MQIVWTFEELMDCARFYMGKAIDASGNANWEVASELILKAIGILEAIEGVSKVTVPDATTTVHFQRVTDLLRHARESYETYHRNAVNYLQWQSTKSETPK
jgi:hypothetical protein